MRKTIGTILVVQLLFLVVAHAGTITVTNTNDDGPGSLREAIVDAASGDKILFDPSLDGHVQSVELNSPLSITKELTIVGRGAGNTIIDANLQSTVLSISGVDTRVVISGVTITGGQTSGDGGGIKVMHGDLTLIDCVVSGNSAGGNGGGIYSRDAGSLVLRSTTVSNNTAASYGGGIYYRGYLGEATFNNSTVAGNSAGAYGGGTYTRSAILTLNSCTVSGNSAGLRGGGLYNSTYGEVRLNGCTVSGNAALYGGGGIDSVPSSFSVILSRSIVGDQDDGSDCFGLNRIVSLGYNLDSDGTCELTQPTDLWFTDPVLGSLADNGGPTWTHALLPRSPAIDAGSCPGTLTDQRGFPRPVNVLGVPNVDDGCDIGAYEYEYGVHWPTADAGQDEAAECTSHEGALVLLDGSGSSDPDSTPGTNDDIVLFEWFENFEEPTEAFLGYGEILEWMLPIGSHVITLRVTDSTGEVGIDEVVKTVVDTTPPGISVSMVPNSLWPPNHRMVDVQALVHAPDICGVTTLTLTSVASDEPDDAPGGGDGRTTNDIQDAAVGTADFDFRLRAERNGGGGGRTYTATYVARDDSGNEASASGEAYVLRDQDGVTDPIQVLIDRDENGFALSWTAVNSAMHYNVIRGRLSDIREMESVIDLGSVLCVEAQSPSEAIIVSETPLSPAPGEGFFYLVEYDDGSRSSYGTESASKPRAPVSGDCF